MNKRRVILTLVFGLLIFSGLVFAANETTSNNITNTNSVSSTTTTANSALNGSAIERAFSCLETQIKSDCSGTNKIQEIALTILASPSGVTQKCYDKLLDLKKTGDCFGDSACNVKDTALAILALNHVGQDTVIYQNWLLNNTRTAENLIWYLEQDSVGKTACRISYDSNDYNFNVLENKKIETAAGNCLSLANSNYWFQINPSCYNKKFTITCDATNGYIATLLYKQPTSPTLYVLSETKSAQSSQPIELSVKSLCFGEGACNYEASAWAAIALDKVGKDIQDYLPYLIAGEDSNQKYLPAAFLQILKDYSEYGTKLIQQQRLNSWEAENTAYNKYYDTGLALLALSSSSQSKVEDAKRWLLNIAQDSNGCWNNNNIRDTAMILWAVVGRRTTVTGQTKPLPVCTTEGFFCVADGRCPTNELKQNYYCGGASNKECCLNENLDSCDIMGGIECSVDKDCTGDEKRASDTDKCCLGECEIPEVKTECETGEGFCRTKCQSTQTEISLDCGEANLVCCKAATKSAESKSYTWLWILLIILILLIIAAIIFREKLKVWIYKIRSGFKKDKGSSDTRPSGFPPAPGAFSSERPVQPRPSIARPLPMQNSSMRPMPPVNGPPMRR